MRVARVVACLSLAATAAFASNLGKYTDWGSSPQAYFMTKAESDQWAAVRTPDQAEQFVNQFLASRGAGFAEEVAKRTAMADKYLTIGKTPGSQTLRGKVIVLLGPPTDFSVADRRFKAGSTGSGMSMYNDMGGGDGRSAGASGPSAADVAEAAARRDMGGKQVREFTIHYDPKKLPASWDRDMTIVIDADPTNGKDRLADTKQASDVDALFDMVAANSVKK